MPSTSCVAVIIAAIMVVMLTTFSSAQYQPYNAAPSILYTFDNNPMLGPAVVNSSTITTITHFSWTNRLDNDNNPNNLNTITNNNHYGIAVFNGILDMINMNVYADNNGRTFNQSYGGNGWAFEYWVWFISLNTATRLADVGNGYYQNNIWNWIQLTNDLAFRIYDGSTEYSYDVPATAYAVTEGNWRHIVCQIVPLGPTSTQGNMTCYINGVQQTTSTTLYKTCNLPNNVVRSQAYFGQIQLSSSTAASITPHFNGYLDLFAFYNNSLTPEQIQAHSLIIRPPNFEVYFGTDPRLINGISGTTTSYTWSATDSSDSSTVQSFHNGLLTLSGTSSYVDLTQNSGANSIGTTLPNIGGRGSGIQQNDGLTGGFSIELVVKINSGAVASRIFSTGNGLNSNEIYVAYDPSGLITFTANNANGAGTTPSLTISGISTGVWYHIAFTLTANNTGVNNGFANNCYAWLNGVQFQQVPYCTYPQSTARSNAFLGTGASSSAAFAGEIDLVRVYDYALGTTIINQLYGLTVTGLPTVSSFVYTPTGLTTSGPMLSYTFDAALPSTFDFGGYGTNFSWISSSGVHSGVASFSGAFDSSNAAYSQNYVDVNLYADIYNNTLPIVGGAFSCEAWVQYQAIPTTESLSNGYARIFELAGANAASANNIAFTQYGTASTLYVATFNNTAESSLQTASANSIVLNQWQHFVMTVGGGTQGHQDSTVLVYINGQNAPLTSTTSLFWTPLYVQRPIGYIGRSAEPGNAFFQGLMDSVSFYNYALSPEQINIRYQAGNSFSYKAPVIDLSFASNLLVTNPTAAYSWAPYDTTDSSTIQTQRTGLLMLNATTTASTSLVYVALSASTGVNSLFMTWPIIGGLPTGNGLAGTQYGWTIEAVFKDQQYGFGVGQSVSNSNIFDWAASAGLTDSLTLGYGQGNQNNRIIYFTVGNGQSAGYSSIPVISPVVFGTWYYVSIVLTPSSTTPGSSPTTGTIAVYVNGQLVVTSPSGAAYPRNIVRPNSFLAKSNSGGATWTGVIDAIRVYDYALTPTQISTLAGTLNLNTAVTFASPSSSSGTVTTTTTAASSASSTAAATTTTATTTGSTGSTTNTGSTGSTNTSGGGSGLSHGAIAGIVIAVVVFCICLLVLLVFFLCYYSPSTKKSSSSSDGNAEVAASNTQNPYAEHSDVQTHTSDAVEMQSTDQETV